MASRLTPYVLVGVRSKARRICNKRAAEKLYLTYAQPL
jgi:hypothetical protein